MQYRTFRDVATACEPPSNGKSPNYSTFSLIERLQRSRHMYNSGNLCPLNYSKFLPIILSRLNIPKWKILVYKPDTIARPFVPCLLTRADEILNLTVNPNSSHDGRKYRWNADKEEKTQWIRHVQVDQTSKRSALRQYNWFRGLGKFIGWNKKLTLISSILGKKKTKLV